MATFNEFGLAGDNLTKREARKIWLQIADTYAQAIKDLEDQVNVVYGKFLAGIKPEDYYNELLKRGRLEALLSNAQKSYSEAATKAGRLQINASRVSITNNYYRQQFALNFGVSADQFVPISDDIVRIAVAGTPKAWEEINARTRARLERTFGNLDNYQPKYGTLTEVLSNNRTRDIGRIRQAINQGIIQGQTGAQVGRNLRRILNTTQSAAERIWRTETHRNRSLGDWANWNQAVNNGIEVCREIVSVLDNRTRAQSADVDGDRDCDGRGFLYPDGNRYEVPGNTGVPAYDINDRERTIQVIPGEDGDTLRRGRNPATGENEVFSYVKFDQWAKEHNLRRNIYGELLPIA